MAETTIIRAPTRVRMSPFHGGAGALVAAGTAVASHDSVTAAYIVAGGGIAGLVLSQITAEIIRNLRARRTVDRTVDHHAELAAEQATLIEHLLTELADERAGRDRAETQLARLHRRRG